MKSLPKVGLGTVSRWFQFCRWCG